MKRARIVTKIEQSVTPAQLRMLERRENWEELILALRHQADEMAAQVGGRVDPDVLPTFLEPQVKPHVLIGGQWLLFAAEWTVLVPDEFDDVQAARNDERMWKDS